MGKKDRFIKCYIYSFNNSDIDPYLNNLGFTRGMVGFAIPDYGVLFRCRVEGDLLDLEFGSFFALLGFIDTRLKDQKIKVVHVFSSNSRFVFSFTGKKENINNNKQRRKLMDDYCEKFSIKVAYINQFENKVLLSPSEFASLPVHFKIPFKPTSSESKKIKIMPFNQGLTI